MKQAPKGTYLCDPQAVRSSAHKPYLMKHYFLSAAISLHHQLQILVISHQKNQKITPILMEQMAMKMINLHQQICPFLNHLIKMMGIPKMSLTCKQMLQMLLLDRHQSLHTTLNCVKKINMSGSNCPVDLAELGTHQTVQEIPMENSDSPLILRETLQEIGIGEELWDKIRIATEYDHMLNHDQILDLVRHL
jgi:hypothetical protein